MRRIPALFLAAACLAGEGKPPSLADRFLEETGWGLDPVPGALVRAPEYCRSKFIQGKGSGGKRILCVGPVGKSSHECEGATQVSKMLEVPSTCRLRLKLSLSHGWGQGGSIGLRVVTPEGKSLASMRVEGPPGAADVEREAEFLLVADAPGKFRFVFDLTCRDCMVVEGVEAEACSAPALDREAMAKVDALAAKLGLDQQNVRDEASEGLRGLLKVKGRVDYGVWTRLKEAAAAAKDAETKAALEGLLAGCPVAVADLRTAP